MKKEHLMEAIVAFGWHNIAELEQYKVPTLKTILEGLQETANPDATTTPDPVDLTVEARALKTAVSAEFKAGIKKNEAARLMLEKAGYSRENDTALNTAVLKACKAAVLVSYRLEGDFAVGDGSEIDKKYKSACSALQQNSAEGRNADGAGTANRTPRTPTERTGRDGAPVKKSGPVTPPENENNNPPENESPTPGVTTGRPEAIRLTENERNAINREIKFEGSMYEFVDKYQNVLWPAIACDEEFMRGFLKFCKAGYARKQE